MSKPVSRTLSRLALAAGLALSLTVLGVSATPSFAEPKAGKGEKVCKIKLKYTGEVKSFVCKVDEPCCVWHEINYVKCGSPIFKCL